MSFAPFLKMLPRQHNEGMHEPTADTTQNRLKRFKPPG